ncbi:MULTISPECIES: hypothetical protein [Asticcacaulis]|uniref:hypothetical protein n=1 Tax=Asticcacaulis TaxID=76890 RepID=UPI001AE3F7E2|nr:MULTISPECIES: hypothetical protein [Asticcacaulis]MBP2157826.1 hypothetical protein [Asticcacaulis solisilvae]MDR6798871.1 hypothetical protein [Asticcacaulis sp. BE141]
MSYASHADFGGREYHSKYEAEAYRPFERRRKPGPLFTSLIAAVTLSVASGAIIVNRLGSLPIVDPGDAVGPITEYTGLQWQENAARKSGVTHGRLAVLTPPVYANQPVFTVRNTSTAVEKVEAEITGAEAAELAAHLDTYPSAQSAQTAAIAEAIAVDVAAAEAMVHAEEQSAPEPRYVLEDEGTLPGRIIEDDGNVVIVRQDDTVSM